MKGQRILSLSSRCKFGTVGWGVRVTNSFASWCSVVINRITAWAGRAAISFASWRSVVIDRVTAWAGRVAISFAFWRSVIINGVTAWAGRATVSFASWRSVIVNRVTAWAGRAVISFAFWCSAIIDRVTAWAGRAVTSFAFWCSAVINRVTAWAGRAVTSFAFWCSAIINRVTAWAGRAVASFAFWRSAIINRVTAWAGRAITPSRSGAPSSSIASPHGRVERRLLRVMAVRRHRSRHRMGRRAAISFAFWRSSSSIASPHGRLEPPSPSRPGAPRRLSRHASPHGGSSRHFLRILSLRHHGRHRIGGARSAVSGALPKLSHRALFRIKGAGRPQCLPFRFRRRGFRHRIRHHVAARREHDTDCGAAWRNAGFPDGAHRHSRAALARAADPAPHLAPPGGAGIRLRRSARTGRHSDHDIRAMGRSSAVEPIFIPLSGRNCRPHACAACVSLCCGGFAQSQQRRRGSGPQRRRESLASSPRRESADGDASNLVCRRAGLPSRFRAVRPAPRARRSAGSARPLDLSLQAQQQAGGLAVSAHGGCRRDHRRDNHAPGGHAASAPE